jgi:hypothetical protein
MATMSESYLGARQREADDDRARALVGIALEEFRLLGVRQDERVPASELDLQRTASAPPMATGPATGASKGPELLDHRLAVYDQEQRMVFGANTYRAFAQMLASSTEDSEVRDPWVTRMRTCRQRWCRPHSKDPLDWPDAIVVSGDAVDVVARLKDESAVPSTEQGVCR